MNNFNRLSYTYINLFNKKRIYDYNEKMPEILYLRKNSYICNTEINKKNTVMKNFMIIYKNLNNGRTLEGLTSANKMLQALLKAENLCNICKANGIQIEVVSITEIVG